MENKTIGKIELNKNNKTMLLHLSAVNAYNNIYLINSKVESIYFDKEFSDSEQALRALSSIVIENNTVTKNRLFGINN